MTIPNRTVTIKNVFAENANTTIPTPPATGVSYRNTETTAAEIGEGWPYKQVVDSAKFNEAMYEYTSICQQLEKYGFLPWSANTDYPDQGCALGSDGNVYQAKQETGPSTTASDPVYDTNHTYWDLFYYSSFTTNRAIVSNASGKLVASSITDTQLSYLSGATSNIQAQINNLNTTVSSLVINLLNSLYPVGSLYIGTQSTCPLTTLISGSTWELVAQDRALWGGNGTNANTTIAAGLPNITGNFGSGCLMNWQGSTTGGALYRGSSGGGQNAGGTDGGTDGSINLDASRSNSIYGSSSTVQPPAYRVNIWRRTA